MVFPRFMSDAEIREYFGLSEGALSRLRMLQQFPRKDPLINKTDRVAVDRFFDYRAGFGEAPVAPDGPENWPERSTKILEAPENPTRAYTVSEFCQSHGVSRSRIYEEIKLGRLRTRKSGRRTLIRAEDAKAWLDLLPDR